MSRRNVTASSPSGLANPFLDVVFKTIFDERTTLEFLNSILKPEHPIVEVHFENSESNDTSIYGKRVYFDVLCTDDTGRKFIVEMQNLWKNFLRNRIVFYSCRKIDEMGRKYETELATERKRKSPSWNYGIQSVCAICLLNDSDGDLEEQYLRQDAVLYDTVNSRVFSDKLRIIIINLRMLEPKSLGISAEYYENLLILMRQISENMTSADALIAAIDDTPFDDDQKALFKRVVQVSDVSSMTEKERAAYEEAHMFYLDQMALISTEREEGIKIGEARGEVRGEKKSMLKVALKMRLRGDSIADIVELTGLSEGEIAAVSQ